MSSTQTFNHVAISVPGLLLDAEGRASLLDFFGEVFGWTEMPTLTRTGTGSCCARTATSSSCS